MELRLKIRQEGKMIHARVDGRQDLLIGSISTAACDHDRTIFEDFQALSIKALNAIVEKTGGGPLESFRLEQPQEGPSA
jgi:hypothetical protein